MAPSARCKFGAPIFESEVFRKRMYCIEECMFDIVRIFGAPAVIRRPGNCAPLPFHYAPAD